MGKDTAREVHWMRRTLALARRACGCTAPNPIVGAVLVENNRIIGMGWHRRAGEPHAEVEAIRDAERRGAAVRGATLYVSLEPCCTFGRTPPCTEAILRAGIRRVVIAAMDPNPQHAGRGGELLRQAGLEVETGLLQAQSERLNEAFNHWIVHRTPFVTLKMAMTLDGKIATGSGESKWITSEASRAWAMRLRQRADAILAGVNTVVADDPGLTFRPLDRRTCSLQKPPLLRVILDSQARVPLNARVVADDLAHRTVLVITNSAPDGRVSKLSKKVSVWVAPVRDGQMDLHWVLQELGRREITSLLVEGGGEVNASFLREKAVHRIAAFYAPKILGGTSARKAVAGDGATRPEETFRLHDMEFRRFGPDLFVTGLLAPSTTKDWESIQS